MHTHSGVVRITDFMPVRDASPALVRIVESLAGEVGMALDLNPRFDYGALPPWWEAQPGGAVGVAGQHRVSLRAPVPLTIEGGSVTGRFTLREGQRLAFALTHAAAWETQTSPFDVEDALASTQAHWEGWTALFDASHTRWPADVKRSLLRTAPPGRSCHAHRD